MIHLQCKLHSPRPAVSLFIGINDITDAAFIRDRYPFRAPTRSYAITNFLAMTAIESTCYYDVLTRRGARCTETMLFCWSPDNSVQLYLHLPSWENGLGSHVCTFWRSNLSYVLVQDEPSSFFHYAHIETIIPFSVPSLQDLRVCAHWHHRRLYFSKRAEQDDSAEASELL